MHRLVLIALCAIALVIAGCSDDSDDPVTPPATEVSQQAERELADRADKAARKRQARIQARQRARKEAERREARIAQAEARAEADRRREASERKEAEEAAEREAESAAAAADCPGVDINSAGAEELQQILHIGPERAGDIINLRPFSSVDDLTRVSGIATVRLAEIKAQGVACAS